MQVYKVDLPQVTTSTVVPLAAWVRLPDVHLPAEDARVLVASGNVDVPAEWFDRALADLPAAVLPTPGDERHSLSPAERAWLAGCPGLTEAALGLPARSASLVVAVVGALVTWLRADRAHHLEEAPGPRLRDARWVLDRLADDPDPRVRVLAAADPQTSPQTLTALQRDRDGQVAAVACNRSSGSKSGDPKGADPSGGSYGDGSDTGAAAAEAYLLRAWPSEEQERRFHGDEEGADRAYVPSTHPQLPGPVVRDLVRLAVRHDSSRLLAAALDHPRCPAELARRVATDKTWVGEVVNHGRTPKLSKQDLGRRWAVLRLAVARASSCPPDVLDRLADDADPAVERAAVRNPSTPRDTLARLAEQSQPGRFRFRQPPWRDLAAQLTPGDPLLDQIWVDYLTPCALACHLTTDLRVTHAMLPDVLRLVRAAPRSTVGPARESALATVGPVPR